MADGLDFTIPAFPDNKTINPYSYTSRYVGKSACQGMSSSIWMVLGGMILAARMLWLALRATNSEPIEEFSLEGQQAECAEEELKDRKNERTETSRRKKQSLTPLGV
ncbi:uncharacterized protein DMAD_03773 [Drosophila madeirensis]|uniref:Uncharacterized protein n=1 Tax=Drosophila madeirensis TaxID=30013 RepID=A0AAU9GAG7_DROMD